MKRVDRVIGGRIKALRLRASLGLAELADKVGVTPEQISYIERGKRNPSVPTLARIAEVLGVDVGDLFAREALPPSRKTG